MHAPTTLARAEEIVLDEVSRLPTEMVALADAHRRVLAETLASPLDLPPFDNSAMDGYALIAADTTGATEAAPVRLTVRDDARAGAPAETVLHSGDAVRIATGAMMPAGADAALRVEDAVRDGNHLLVSAPLDPGTDVRPAGDDLHSGAIVLDAGTVLRAGELAMLASIGSADVRVVRGPRVAIVGTGDELVAPGTPLGPGQIYDSNMPMLAALVTGAGGEVASAAIRVADTLTATVAALEAALVDADLVLISGGVSKGAHDHVKPALKQLGAEQRFWQLAVRPGHPTWFGVSSAHPPVPILGLPGNPASSYVVFQMLAAPAIRAMLGITAPPLEVDATYRGATQHKRPGFIQVLRCTVGNEGSDLVARPTGQHQRSHAVSSLTGTNGLVLLSSTTVELADGDAVTVRLLDH